MRGALALAIALPAGRQVWCRGGFAPLWHVPNARAIRSTIFLKMRRVGHYFSNLSNVNYFLKVQVAPKPFTCPLGKSLLVECPPLDDQIVRALLLPTRVYRPYGRIHTAKCIIKYIPYYTQTSLPPIQQISRHTGTINREKCPLTNSLS